MMRVNHHTSWKFGKNENPCFHSLPRNPVHSLLTQTQHVTVQYTYIYRQIVGPTLFYLSCLPSNLIETTQKVH